MTTLVVSFAAILAGILPGTDPALLSHQDWTSLPRALPVFVCALVFHNIVPIVCLQQQGDPGRVRTAILAGTGLPLAMYALFSTAILAHVPAGGVLVDASVVEDQIKSLIASAPFSSLLFPAFSFAAITTSSIGTAVSQVEEVAAFLGAAGASASGPSPSSASAPTAGTKPAPEGWARRMVGTLMVGATEAEATRAASGKQTNAQPELRRMEAMQGKAAPTATGGGRGSGAVHDAAGLGKAGLLGLVFVPPLALANTFPGAFQAALEVGGTYGDVVLFGAIPVLMAWRQREAMGEDGGGLRLLPGDKLPLIGIGVASLGLIAAYSSDLVARVVP